MEMFLDDKHQHQISIDKTEPIILASFLLPYTVERNKKTGELTIHKCFHNPTMLYGTLENMIQKKQFNFKWIGLVTTLEDVSEQEKAQLTASFKQMNAYPIFMTSQELAPYLLFYENIIRPLFHNFKDLYDMRNEYLKYWKDYVEVNKKSSGQDHRGQERVYTGQQDNLDP
jgi:trehalose-6-phosphate synthase